MHPERMVEDKPPEESGAGGTALTRRLRAATGLILFAYVTAHLLTHAAGVFLFEGMERAGQWLLAPWRVGPGPALLYGSLLVHTALGLVAVVRRRSWAMPWREAMQLALGLAVPLLLLSHLVSVRAAERLYGIDDSFERLVLQYWVLDPWGVTRQFLLMAVVWLHGCLGIRFLVAHRRWARAVATPALLGALMLPILAVLGLLNVGFELRGMVEADPAAAAAVLARAGGPDAAEAAAIAGLARGATAVYAALAAAVLGGTAGLVAWRRRFRSVAVRYPGGRTVLVPFGATLLDASRAAGLPHRSVCGGRGRCSTCRVHVLVGADRLPPPGDAERSALRRVGAEPDVRLACQVRPAGPVTVAPLLPPDGARGRGGYSFAAGREADITTLFVDLRESTALVHGRLPYDALFVVDRYIQAATREILAQGGIVTSIAGDGIMALFGAEGRPGRAACDALEAAAGLLDAVGRLNVELAADLDRPLRIGIGIASGLCVVGELGTEDARTVQFLGDPGNTAARLEALTKEHGVPALVSAETARRAGLPVDAGTVVEVAVRGRAEPLAVLRIGSAAELRRARAAPRRADPLPASEPCQG